MNEIQDKIKDWDRYYQVGVPTIVGKIMYKAHRKVLDRVMNSELNLPKNMKILDIGCGKGSTLKSFRKWGFDNSIGIELADTGLVRCQNNGLILGKDVFKIDATCTPYEPRSFNVCFSEGLLEHYKDFSPFVDEMCRLSDDYIILVQPNHFSLYSRLLQFGWELLRKNSGGVREYPYKFATFYRIFAEKGFTHILTRFTTLREVGVIVFKRK